VNAFGSPAEAAHALTAFRSVDDAIHFLKAFGSVKKAVHFLKAFPSAEMAVRYVNALGSSKDNVRANVRALYASRSTFPELSDAQAVSVGLEDGFGSPADVVRFNRKNISAIAEAVRFANAVGVDKISGLMRREKDMNVVVATLKSMMRQSKKRARIKGK
jgi:hypothetical protein